MPLRQLAVVMVALASSSCIHLIDDLEFCSDTLSDPISIDGEVTWHQDVRPIIEGRCVRCHAPGEVGPFPLTNYEETFASRELVRQVVEDRTMPPWLPAQCCNEFRDDVSLSNEQIATISAWVQQGAPEGDPSDPAEPLESVGGLSRVDVTLTMPEPYLPQPENGRVDDFRCFLIDWPLDEGGYITGVNPRPGARELVHHLIVATVSESEAQELERISGRDGRPGFPCEGGFGNIRSLEIVGGSLLGGDFPEDLGRYVDADVRVLLNIHYSLTGVEPREDQTSIELRIDDDAREFETIPIANPAWLVDNAMHVDAGDPDARYSYQFDPGLITRRETVYLWGYTPHMHALGNRMITAVVRRDDDIECMAEMPNYDYGWEQPHWFAEPVRLRPGDQLYIQCHIDNSANNQPIIDGTRAEPRDIAWGTDNQEMCAGFYTFTRSR